MKKSKLCDGEGYCEVPKEVPKVKKDIRVYFCPKCRSLNIKYVFELGNLFGSIPTQRCMDCKFKAQGFPILEATHKELELIENKLKKKLKIKNNKKIKKKLKINKAKR